ncbi:hypothetical protein ACTJJ0_11670 [Chitinophaga sp. 22321]|uniref:Uncharacterized protein n=1 Tax=Chitinophaga hostae TaxID=2831022 RepID=A0ABS5IW57_9BACT|nr:hypothetical protein [Chitinophaga hostae]MBS0027189.1 hypothetical protein [Chitinophaga hostae]
MTAPSFLKSVTAHFRKTVDLVAVDLKDLNKERVAEVMDYIKLNHASDMNRLIAIGGK